MQYSQLEREMHNSPLKCQTNSESPDKASPKLQSQAYKFSSGSKKSAANFSSPTKHAAAHGSPSPQKNATSLLFSGEKGENRVVEDSRLRSPPQKKYASPSRDAKRSSPSKN